jgi:predicted amino acid dehydrogenase
MTRKLITVIDFFNKGSPRNHHFSFGGCDFEITSFPVGWDMQTAKILAKKYDGYADAIVFIGLFEQGSLFQSSFTHKPSLAILNLVHESKVFTGQRLREIFASWTLGRLIKQNPAIFRGKKALVHASVVSPALEPLLNGGAQIYCADLLSLLNLPVSPLPLDQFRSALTKTKPILSRIPLEFLAPGKARRTRELTLTQRMLRKSIRKSDLFVTFRGILDDVGNYNVLKNKTIIADGLNAEQKNRLIQVGVSQIIECAPDFRLIDTEEVNQFGVMDAVIDLLREVQAPQMKMEQYVLHFIEEHNLAPPPVISHSLSPLRCAFLIHPLSREHLYLSPYFRWMKNAPNFVQNQIESQLRHVPPFVHGQISGLKSAANGREVICDILSLASTPRVMRQMPEDVLYEQLLQAAQLAQSRGACMLGLGAYTKVIGDAGITVAKKAPIPITNGNSYSTAATLWAAREMSIKMQFLRPNAKHPKRIAGKAMVIGATGCIGRVSSHLLALVFDEIILVGRRADKLLEIKDEVKKLSSHVRIEISTDPSPYLATTDLIVTATSNEGGAVLDIMMVKPGAVICDCSRPLDIGPEETKRRPDVMIIESGEIDLPGTLSFSCDIGLPHPSVYACLAETVLLTMEERFESFSLGKQLTLTQVKEIYQIGIKHGAQLSAIRGPLGFITEQQIEQCRILAAAGRALGKTGKL